MIIIPSYTPLVVDPNKYPRQSFCNNCTYFGKFYMQLKNGKYSYQHCGRCTCKGGKFNNHIMAADGICNKHEWSDEALERQKELIEKRLC